MKIIDLNDSSVVINPESVGVALGNFDGLHRGHVELIRRMIEGSNERKLKSSVLLFKNHTKMLLNNKNKIKILTSNDEKIRLLEELGIDIVFLIDFNEELMKLSGEDFIKDILVDKMNTKYVTVGFDYRFGYKAQSTSKDLYSIGQIYGIEANILDAIYIDGELISSTMIRNLISDGRIKEANNYLAREYRIEGRVIHGKNRGTKLGFPTANLEKTGQFIIPKIGVYHTTAYIDNKAYDSLTNIGYNPTFNDDELTIESYILDFDEDIYGKVIYVDFIDYLRDDIKFNSPDELVEQMKEDVKAIINR